MKNALLLSRIDDEDLDVTGFVFILDPGIETYERAFDAIIRQLEDTEFQKELFRKLWLSDIVKDGFESCGKISITRWENEVTFSFINIEEEEIILKMDFVTLWDTPRSTEED